MAQKIVLLAAAVLISSTLLSARPRAASPPPSHPTAAQLEQLSRALKEPNPAAYKRLSDFASQNSKGTLGYRAALALGYYDYSRGNYAEAIKWLERAKSDALLRDYSLYWSAQTNLALNNNRAALGELTELRRQYPESVMTELALGSIGTAAFALDEPAAVIDALNGYALTSEKPALLFLRAEARERAGQTQEAAADYHTVYLVFPLSPEGRDSGLKLSFLRSVAGNQIPEIPIGQRLAHASALFDGKLWSEARTEYSGLIGSVSGADRERAELRILECGVSFGAGPSELEKLNIADPDTDAERLYSLAQWFRSQQQGSQMEESVKAAVARAPGSHWAEASLFLAGNYFWVQLDRDRAVSYYAQVANNFPGVPDAIPSQWRVAFTAVLKRQPEATALLTEHIRRFPRSPFTPDALFWLGRLAQESGDIPLARAYYNKLAAEYPRNYFTSLAVPRLHDLGSGQLADPDVFGAIPPRAAVRPLGGVIPEAAANRQARAAALRSIAFDASAELELRAAFASTGEPRLLLEAAQAAVQSGHCGAAIVMIRQIYPQIEARPFDEVPKEVWQAAYPLPFANSIKQWSGHAGVDAMLTAGLIRQESAFAPDAISVANALGLMQLLPKTARILARQARVRYSRAQLFNPDYNVRLGTIYFAGLKTNFGSVESALAAYNAGEDRVTSWTSGQNYRDIAEFVDAIPFTETREYVQIVSQNASIYRQIYGTTHEPIKRKTSHAR